MTSFRPRDLGGADPYALLGVDPAADDEAIIRAYRQRIRQVHPDLISGDEEQAKLLHIARDLLLDPVTRREYDQVARRGGTHPSEVIEDPPVASAWDDDDVTTEPMASPIADAGSPPPSSSHGYEQYEHDRSHHEPYYATYSYEPVSYAPLSYAPYRYVDPPLASRPQSRLGVAALVLSVLCGPLGLILAIVALTVARSDDSADRVCAWIAAVWGGLWLCGCLGYFGSLWASTLVPAPDV